jgi:hypothetical protein
MATWLIARAMASAAESEAGEALTATTTLRRRERPVCYDATFVF